jgi:carboxymethylenebutenolidase
VTASAIIAAGAIVARYNKAMNASDREPPVPEISSETRREFLAARLATGFALAMLPAAAQTIATDTNGLTAGDVKIPVTGGEIPGYRACPSRGGSFPAVLVVHEVFGVNERIKDICRRFAKVGYCAVAPGLFSRQGDFSKITDAKQIMDTVVSKVPDSQVMSDLDASIAWAIRSSRASSLRLAVTGFSWGGRITWLYAALNSNLKAAAAWYGLLAGKTNPLTPKQPLDYAGGLKAPVIGFYGGKDAGIPAESIELMRTALSVVEDPSQINVYPDAQHDFFADGQPSYNKEAAEDAWQKMLAWFKNYGA